MINRAQLGKYPKGKFASVAKNIPSCVSRVEGTLKSLLACPSGQFSSEIRHSL